MVKRVSTSSKSNPEIVGVKFSRYWFGIHCSGDQRQICLPNTEDGHSELEKIAKDRKALVCFESANGCEWWLWANLAMAGVQVRQVSPAQVKAFGRSRGTLAEKDLTDAELIADFIAVHPQAGFSLPSGILFILKTLMAERKQLVDTRKMALQRNKANLKNETARSAEDQFNEDLELLEREIAMDEAAIQGILAAMIDEDETAEQIE